MSELESLALLIADLNAQVRTLQQENAALRAQAEHPPASPADSERTGGKRPRSRQ